MKRRLESASTLFSNGKYEDCANVLREKENLRNKDADGVMIDECVRKYNIALCAKRNGEKTMIDEEELTSLAKCAESDVVAILICETAALLLEEKKNIDRAWRFVEHVKNTNTISRASNEVSRRFRMIRSFALASKGLLDSAEQILKIDEDMEEIYLKAAIMTLNGRFDEAQKVCLNALDKVRKIRERRNHRDEEDNTPMGPIVYLLAHLYLKQDNAEEASRCFQACIQGRMYRPEESENAQVFAIAKCGRIREAIEKCREIVRSQGHESSQGIVANFNMALLYARVNHYAESLRILRGVVKSFPGSSGNRKETTIEIGTIQKVSREYLYGLLGDVAVRAGNYKEATSIYTQMPSSRSKRSRLVFAMLQSGKYDEVISMTEKEENDVNMLMYEADALVCLDRVSEALSRIEKILVLEEKSSIMYLVARHNQALLLLCSDRVDEAVNILSELYQEVVNSSSQRRRKDDDKIPESISEQIHFNYTLALWKIGKSTTACTQWLVSRGFVAPKQDDVLLSPATVGHLDRFSRLLDIQRAALAKEKSKNHGAIVDSHVNAATPPVPKRSDAWSSSSSSSSSSVMRNRVSKLQLLALDVKVLSHWCQLQQNEEFSKGVLVVEKGL